MSLTRRRRFSRVRGEGRALRRCAPRPHPEGSAEGRLNVMVGADPDVYARIEPVLRAFAENIFHVGGPGTAQDEAHQ